MRLILGVSHLLRIVIEDLEELSRGMRKKENVLTLSISSKPSGGVFVLLVRILGIATTCTRANEQMLTKPFYVT